MSNYKQYSNLNLPEIDKEVLEFWEKNNVFEKSVTQREGAEKFNFIEGPPSANGMPGIHHVMSRAIKDTFCRFQTMNGKQVKRKAGWDTHGLPIELAVEKELGITKEDIGKKISVDEYNAKCRETVMRFKDKWDGLTKQMGYWVDLENPYITFENNYIESVWNLLKRLYDKDYLYKGYTIQPYSPAAGTGLSSHELNQPGCYKEVKDTTVVAMFKVKKDEKSAFLFSDENEDVRILAWTTTPWTLPSNTALTVGPKIEYVKVKTFNPYTAAPVSVMLAKALVGKWFNAEGKEAEMTYETSQKMLPWRITAETTGAALEGVSYNQLFAFGNEIEPLDGKTDAFKVILGDFVTTEDGTGVVHTAPSFGADDRKAARAAGIGTLTLVDKQGKFLDTVGEFSNRYVKNYRDEVDYKEVDVDIAVRLKLDGYAFNVKKYEHNYPHCWRTDKPILYYPLDSWFIAASRAKERMSELNKTINWKPESTGTGRFGTWLDNLQDWNLSRSRYWGIPLPIWRTEDSSEALCIGSIAELSVEIEKANNALGLNQTVPQDLHRPYIDNVVLVSASGQKMTRELDLIDVWFDSGSVPYAQEHFPMENPDLLKGNWQADFIAEGVDQTRGWFYTLHAIGVMCFDSVAYKNVISNGLVLDMEGQKMSKRLGNAVEPFYTLNKYGADATRWYMLTNANPWDNLKFSWIKEKDDAGNVTNEFSPGIEGVQRSFFGKLFNLYNFFATYANIDNFQPSKTGIKQSDCTEIDNWILSKLNHLVKEVYECYKDYDVTRAGRAIEEFTDEHLSNWYVRLNRRRFWKGEVTADKIVAYQTLHTCLNTIAQLAAPIAPFFMDWLFQNLNPSDNNLSVHLSLFPQADESLIDEQLEKRMDYAQRTSSLVLSLRKREKIRVRQPLQKILLPVLSDDFEMQVESVKSLILAEVNIKEIEYIKDTGGLVTKKIKPNFTTLGKRLGALMKPFQEKINGFSQEDINLLEKSGGFVFEHQGQQIETSLTDFLITSEGIAGWSVANDKDLTVALDVTITPDLLAEGYARELVSFIQDLRKETNLEVTDRIVLEIESHPELEKTFAQFGDYIGNEVLATSLQVKTEFADDASVASLTDKLSVRIAIKKV